MNESGQWSKSGQPNGKSSNNLRRVHVLTDPVRRDASGPEPLVSEKPVESPEKPSGDVLIGGTREEVETASRATTVKLDPQAAASALKAAALADIGPDPQKTVDEPAEAKPEPDAKPVVAAPPISPSELRDSIKAPALQPAVIPPAPVSVPEDDLVPAKPPYAMIAAGGGLLLLIVLIFSC